MARFIETDHGLISSNYITRIIPAPEGWAVFYTAGAEERSALATPEDGQELVNAIGGSARLCWTLLAVIAALIGAAYIYFAGV